MIYEPRTYRDKGHRRVDQHEICIGDTDLFIISDWWNDELVSRWIRQLRSAILREIESHPHFLDALAPVTARTSHPLIQRMTDAACAASVGPMAAVAGAIAEGIGKRLLEMGQDAVVENGGDLFVAYHQDIIIRLMAGSSPLSNQMGIRIKKEQMPAGLCTSSGTVGHSLSFGKADAAVILSKNVALADAVATATANRVQTADDIASALEFASSIEGIEGALIVVGDAFGAIGQIELVKI